MEKSGSDFFERLKKGDESALISIYETYRGEFFQWCMSGFSADEDEAADIFQESVVALYYNVRNGRLTELSSTLKTYLFAIGKNIALKKLKKDAKMIVNDELLEINSGLVTEDLFEKTEQQKVIAELLNEMGDPCKSILTLFYFDRFAMDAIASRLGYKNEHVVKSQKLRCFKHLKKLVLERYNQDEI
ncbi:RNA polymerase sigma factor [Fulvivirga sp. M361]|uniref:RNA polymerase sigma factor n=1 Tax=Fulvivirga sp. M361 TaxID=2594266 RepID=UPI0016237636|nr:sigma-70 family RNA polymerase sigma factor [Fulvivirga sp. M361]